jgi:hemerythrin-like metal-binding protein
MEMPLLEDAARCAKDLESQQAGLSRMLGLANDLCEGLRAGQGRTFMEQRIDQLLELMKSHFACEESLLEQMHHVRLAAQHHEHQNLTEWLKQMRVRLADGTLPSPPVEVAGYLRDWLSEHVRRSDQDCLSEVCGRELR